MYASIASDSIFCGSLLVLIQFVKIRFRQVWRDSEFRALEDISGWWRLLCLRSFFACVIVLQVLLTGAQGLAVYQG